MSERGNDFRHSHGRVAKKLNQAQLGDVIQKGTAVAKLQNMLINL